MIETPPKPGRLMLEQLNAGTADAFVAALGDVFEHSPWVAVAAAAHRPFVSARALHDALLAAVIEAPAEQQRALIALHPELAGREAVEGQLTDDSASEQGRLGFTALGPAEHADLLALNARYRTQFGMPCIIALTRHAGRETVFAELRARLSNDAAAEHAATLEAIGHITGARLARRLGLAGGSLSIHTLDTATGQPGADMAFELLVQDGNAWRSILHGRTDAEGRTRGPLLANLDMAAGAYRLDFQVGDYHRRHGVPCGSPAYLETVPVVFGIADPAQHYHVPLLFTPWSYSTYRGN